MGLTYYGTSKAVIDSPGDYTIDRDITCTSPNDAAVIINAGVHYVTLHLRSRLVAGFSSSGISRGIEANGSAQVCLLGEGGSISGFRWGVRLSGCYLARVRGLFLPSSLFCGIEINGDACCVEDNDIREVYGSTFAANERCRGIGVYGSAPKVQRNLVTNVRATGLEESLGISIDDLAQNGMVIGNVIKNDVLVSKGQGRKSYGIWVGGSSNVVVAHNTIDTWEAGLTFSSPPTGFIDENAYRNCVVNVQDGGDGDVIRGDDNADALVVA